MTATDTQRTRRAAARADLAARRVRRLATLPPVVPVIRMDELPLPETVAYVRAQYGPHAVILVEAP